MNLRNWSGQALATARAAFPAAVDLADVYLEARSGRTSGDPGFKRRMGRNSRNKVRRFLVEADLASFDHPARLLKAKPPPAGMSRDQWIAQAWVDVGAAMKEVGQ
jgi:hypothetical protein